MVRHSSLTAPLIDMHTHTSFSDGESSLAENVEAALERGISRLCATDHLTLPHIMDPDCEASVPEERLAEFAREIAEQRETHPELEIVWGFECDWYEGCEENIARWSTGATFLLGSVHALDGHWIDWKEHMEIWEEMGADWVWKRYVEVWCEACASSVAFDSMAHPDLAQRFSNEGWRPSINLTPLFETMATCAHDTGRHIEVSTAGLRNSVDGYYPCPELLAAFARAEVPLTFGSDAHAARDIGWGLRDAYTYAYASGYRSFDAPRVEGGWEHFEL